MLEIKTRLKNEMGFLLFKNKKRQNAHQHLRSSVFKAGRPEMFGLNTYYIEHWSVTGKNFSL